MWGSLTEGALDDEKVSAAEVTGTYLITYGDDPSKTAVTLGEKLFGNGDLPLGENFLIVTKRVLGETNSGVFHNSNHYGYYLSICVIVAAVMMMKEKNILNSVLYGVSYAIMLGMAIINNTLGSYLGICVAIIFMVIYALIPKDDTENGIKEIIKTVIIVGVLVFLSVFIVNTEGKNIVYTNISGLLKDLNILAESNDVENLETIEISGEMNVAEENSDNESATDNIGSGRGVLWEKAGIMALQRPLFGYGLENILYEYNNQFGISEGRSHNLVLQLAATTGIVGMLLYVVGIASIWIRKLKYVKAWDMYECLGMFVIVSYIVSSLFGNSGFYTSGYFYIFVGFVILKTSENGMNSNITPKNVNNNKRLNK